jgi:putative methyltransferase
VNTLKTTLDEELHHGTFSNFTEVTSLDEIVHAAPDARVVYQDAHIPNLLAVATPDDPTTFQAYRNGGLILQEKASCFPAYLLNPESSPGDIVDACAAPGNKTTHLAALVGPENGRRVFACERNPERSQTLRKMVKMARAEKIVTIKEKQDFTRLDPNAREFANVTGLLLDPSCSGSGIFGRDEGSIAVHLPSSTANAEVKGKKRKRGGKVEVVEAEQAVETAIVEEIPEEGGNLATRLINLSTFQLRIVQHAMSFPAAERITYSTCSLHDQENEHVVVKALSSTIATQRGWRVLSREEQMDGLRKWQKRGNPEAVSNALTALDEDMRTQLSTQVDSIADSCIRCDKGGADGTMGFFVAAFVRDKQATAASQETPIPAPDDDDADEWSGFGDD